MANKILCSLFYIELESAPLFYSSIERCTVKLHCRLPPGDELQELLHFFWRNKTRMIYKGSETEYSTLMLCTENNLKANRENAYFSREFSVEVRSWETKIMVELCDFNGYGCSVSHCPYRLRDLVRDQGLCFQAPTLTRGQKLDLHTEIGNLLRTLS